MKLRNPWGQGEWTGDWSDNSEKWTPALRAHCGSTVEDDGFFFIPLQDYWEEYCNTSICVEFDENKYFHSKTIADFNDKSEDDQEYQAFFRFDLKKSVRFDRDCFAISVFQQGDRLGQYRLCNETTKFKPSQFNIVLMKECGEFVKANFGSAFMHSLLNDETTLTEGSYCLMIDPIWHSSAENDPQEFKRVLVDIYAPEEVYLDEVDSEEGLELLARSFKHASQTLSPDSKRVRYL